MKRKTATMIVAVILVFAAVTGIVSLMAGSDANQPAPGGAVVATKSTTKAGGTKTPGTSGSGTDTPVTPGTSTEPVTDPDTPPEEDPYSGYTQFANYSSLMATDGSLWYSSDIVNTVKGGFNGMQMCRDYGGTERNAYRVSGQAYLWVPAGTKIVAEDPGTGGQTGKMALYMFNTSKRFAPSLYPLGKFTNLGDSVKDNPKWTYGVVECSEACYIRYSVDLGTTLAANLTYNERVQGLSKVKIYIPQGHYSEVRLEYDLSLEDKATLTTTGSMYRYGKLQAVEGFTGETVTKLLWMPAGTKIGVTDGMFGYYFEYLTQDYIPLGRTTYTTSDSGEVTLPYNKGGNILTLEQDCYVAITTDISCAEWLCFEMPLDYIRTESFLKLPPTNKKQISVNMILPATVGARIVSAGESNVAEVPLLNDPSKEYKGSDLVSTKLLAGSRDYLVLTNEDTTIKSFRILVYAIDTSQESQTISPMLDIRVTLSPQDGKWVLMTFEGLSFDYDEMVKVSIIALDATE